MTSDICPRSSTCRQMSNQKPTGSIGLQWPSIRHLARRSRHVGQMSDRSTRLVRSGLSLRTLAGYGERGGLTMSDDAIREAPARRRLEPRRRGRPARAVRHRRRLLAVLLLARAGLPLVLQSLHSRPLARGRHRHRLLADGGARHRRHEPRRRLDRRLRRDVHRLADPGPRPADPGRDPRRAGARRRCSAGSTASPSSRPASTASSSRWRAPASSSARC